MELTQSQLDINSQCIRKKHIKLELLDFSMKLIDSIEGVAIDGSINADASNPIRRSGEISIAIPINLYYNSFLDRINGLTININGKIWIDKYIKIYVGVEDLKGSIVWNKIGVFLIDEPEQNFDNKNFIISFRCIDLMAKLTGLRQGQLTSITTLIEKGHYEKNLQTNKVEYIKTKMVDVFISAITELGGFSKYIIYPIPDYKKFLPYDIKLGIGSTVYDLLQKLLDILSTWQMYFDNDGILNICPIPSGENNMVYNIFPENYISCKKNISFQNVKNQIIIYGRVNELSYYTENTDAKIDNVEYKDNLDGTSTLILKYDAKIDISSLTISGVTFGFKSLKNKNALPINKVEIWSENTPLIQSNDLRTISLVNFENSNIMFGNVFEDSKVPSNMIKENDIYFIRIYKASLLDNEIVDINKDIVFEFMGKQSVSYSMVNDNKESPFYINASFNGTNYYAIKVGTKNNAQIGENYELTINDFENIQTIKNGTILTFISNGLNKHDNVLKFTSVNVKNSTGQLLLENIPIVENTFNDGTFIRPYLKENKIDNDYTVWTLKYDSSNNGQFIFLGKNPYIYTKVCSGGEFDNIYTDQLAYDRCLWELFNSSNTNDSISLGIVPDYAIDVNYKIKYNENNSLPLILRNENFKDEYYMVKKITYQLGVGSNSQLLNAIRVYNSGNLLNED